MREEELKIIETMEKYGGSFVKALAECFRRADLTNFKKLKKAFLDYWMRYKEMSDNKPKE